MVTVRELLQKPVGSVVLILRLGLGHASIENSEVPLQPLASVTTRA